MQHKLSQGQTDLAGVWSVRSRLETALATCWQQAAVHSALPPIPNLQDQIALRRVDAPTGVVYSSAIAPRLADNLGIPPGDLASLLAQSWLASTGDNADWADSPLRVTQKHLVQVHLGDRLLAAWLQQFTRTTESWSPNLSPKPEILPTIPNSAPLPPAQSTPERFQDKLLQDEYFEMQAAHARCCSRLALAERVGLVRFGVQEKIDSELVWPTPLPWLTAEGTLRTRSPVERRLIWQLLDSVEVLEPVRHRSAIALAQTLSRHVYAFDASCRIFGDVASDQLELAQARLGLVRAAQQTLRWLLEGLVQVAAPHSL